MEAKDLGSDGVLGMRWDGGRQDWTVMLGPRIPSQGDRAFFLSVTGYFFVSNCGYFFMGGIGWR